MGATYAAGARRQSVVLTAIAGLHLGAFVLIASGLGPRVMESLVPDPPITVVFREEVLTAVVAPDETFPEEVYFQPVPRPEPWIIPQFDELPPIDAVAADTPMPGHGEGVDLATVDYRAPALRMRDSRLAALINSCYPAGARREGEEGRVTARISVNAAGQAGAWSVAASSGFQRLDAALACVIRRVEFVAGREGGRAVSAEVFLPIVFRLN